MLARLCSRGAELLPEIDKFLLEPKEWPWVFEAWATIAPHCGDREEYMVDTVLAALPKRSYLQHWAAELIAKLADRGIELLLKKLKTDSWAATRVLRTVAMKHPRLVWAHCKVLEPYRVTLLDGLVASPTSYPFMLEAGKKLCDDPDPRVRSYAHRLLGKVGAAAVPFLLSELKARPDRLREILGAAHEIGLDAHMFIARQMELYRNSDDQTLRTWLLTTLPRYGRRGIVALEMMDVDKKVIGPILIRGLNSKAAATRRAAARALIAVDYASKLLMPAVIQLMRSKDPRDARWATVAFANLLPRAPRSALIVHALTDMLISQPAKSRRQLVRSMGKMAAWGEEIAVLLGGALFDPDESVRQAALQSVQRWGAAARKLRPLVEELRQDPSESVRQLVDGVLSAMGSQLLLRRLGCARLRRVWWFEALFRVIRISRMPMTKFQPDAVRSSLIRSHRSNAA